MAKGSNGLYPHQSFIKDKLISFREDSMSSITDISVIDGPLQFEFSYSKFPKPQKCDCPYCQAGYDIVDLKQSYFAQLQIYAAMAESLKLKFNSFGKTRRNIFDVGEWFDPNSHDRLPYVKIQNDYSDDEDLRLRITKKVEERLSSDDYVSEFFPEISFPFIKSRLDAYRSTVYDESTFLKRK